MKILDKIKQRYRLWRIEKAIGARLSKKQREIVLCPDRPFIAGTRGSGKTLTACAWVLFHRKEPLIVREALTVYSRNKQYPFWDGYKRQPFPVPDPDLDNQQMAVFCLNHLIDMWARCRKKKIPVFDMYSTYEQYKKAQVDKK